MVVGTEGVLICCEASHVQLSPSQDCLGLSVGFERTTGEKIPTQGDALER